MTDLSLLPKGYWTVQGRISRLEDRLGWERRSNRRRQLWASLQRWQARMQVLRVRQALER